MAILREKKEKGIPDRGGFRGTAAAAALLLALIFFLAWRQAGFERHMKAPQARAPEETLAKMEKAGGGVLVRRKGALDYRAAPAGTALNRGDIVQTTGGAEAVLLFKDETRVSLGGDSLLVISEPPGARPSDRKGTVLRIEKGEISVSSDDMGEEIEALQTPTAIIHLQVRETGIFNPEEYRNMLPGGAGGGTVESAARHGYLYLIYLKNNYLPPRPEPGADPRIVEIFSLLEDAERACSSAFDEKCVAAQDAAWLRFREARGLIRGQKKVAVTASVDENGKEDIKVAQGVVKVETKTRSIAIAGGESVSLEPGKAVTRPDVSEKALGAMAADTGGEEEEPVKIEVFYWQ